MNNSHARLLALFAGVAVAAALVAPAFLGSVRATHQPADKLSAASSVFEVLSDELVSTDPNAPLVTETTDVAGVLTGTMRTSSPTDLIIQVTLECALWTKVATIGNDASETTARVKVWVEIDGAPVKVSTLSTDASGNAIEDDGKVVFCDRVHKQSVSDLDEQGDDDDANIEQFLRTRTANAFNWVALNVGSGVHNIEVKAELETAVEGVGAAQAGIGKRTLVVEPTKLANDVVL